MQTLADAEAALAAAGAALEGVVWCSGRIRPLFLAASFGRGVCLRALQACLPSQPRMFPFTRGAGDAGAAAVAQAADDETAGRGEGAAIAQAVRCAAEARAERPWGAAARWSQTTARQYLRAQDRRPSLTQPSPPPPAPRPPPRPPQGGAPGRPQHPCSGRCALGAPQGRQRPALHQGRPQKSQPVRGRGVGATSSCKCSSPERVPNAALAGELRPQRPLRTRSPVSFRRRGSKRTRLPLLAQHASGLRYAASVLGLAPQSGLTQSGLAAALEELKALALVRAGLTAEQVGRRGGGPSSRRPAQDGGTTCPRHRPPDSAFFRGRTTADPSPHPSPHPAPPCPRSRSASRRAPPRAPPRTLPPPTRCGSSCLRQASTSWTRPRAQRGGRGLRRRRRRERAPWRAARV
jgi:hypothetical protein